MGGGWVRERACLLLASRPAALMLAPPPPPLTRRPRPLLLKQTGVSAGAQGLQALVALNRGGSSWLAVSVQQLRACWSVRRRPAGRPHKILWHGAWRQQLWSVCQMQRSAALPTRRVYALGAWRPEPARGAWPGRRHASASARRDFCAEVAALRHPRPAIRVPRNRLAEPHYCVHGGGISQDGLELRWSRSCGKGKPRARDLVCEAPWTAALCFVRGLAFPPRWRTLVHSRPGARVRVRRTVLQHARASAERRGRGPLPTYQHSLQNILE